MDSYFSPAFPPEGSPDGDELKLFDFSSSMPTLITEDVMARFDSLDSNTGMGSSGALLTSECLYDILSLSPQVKSSPMSARPALVMPRFSGPLTELKEPCTTHEKNRKNFTAAQRAALNGWLRTNATHPYLEPSEISLLANELDLTARQVRVYLTNGRMRILRRKKGQQTSGDSP